MVAVVVVVVPSFSATLDDGQYQYLLATRGNDQSKSERLRELVDKGIEVEENE